MWKLHFFWFVWLYHILVKDSHHSLQVMSYIVFYMQAVNNIGILHAFCRSNLSSKSTENENQQKVKKLLLITQPINLQSIFQTDWNLNLICTTSLNSWAIHRNVCLFMIEYGCQFRMMIYLRERIQKTNNLNYISNYSITFYTFSFSFSFSLGGGPKEELRIFVFICHIWK